MNDSLAPGIREQIDGEAVVTVPPISGVLFPKGTNAVHTEGECDRFLKVEQRRPGARRRNYLWGLGSAVLFAYAVWHRGVDLGWWGR